MEVRKGFKQTDLGVIPYDWNTAEIGKLNFDISDGNYSSKYPKASDFKEIGIPFIRANNISGMKVIDDQMRFISVTQHNELLRGHLKKNDILITTRGELGNIALVPDKHIGSNINAQIVRINTRQIVDHVYFAYILSYDSIQKKIKDAETGSALKQLPVGKLVKIPIIIPPIPEQHAIATLLSDVDALLNSLDALIAKKHLIKQGAMQELLTGKKRLPGFSSEWEVKPLGEIAEIVMGQSPSSAYYNKKGDGLPLIQGNADISNRQTIKRVFTTQVTKFGRSGDVLMSVRAPVGEISRATFDVCLGRGVCAIRYPNNYLYHYLIFKEPTWVKLSKGSTFDAVNSADVRAFLVEVSTDEKEQTAIAEILSDMDAEISALEQKREKTRLLKQGMMQELLTGRIRLQS